jgi:S1-C subfamily serine protease
MKRTLLIVLTAAVVGGLAGAAIGLTLDDGRSPARVADAGSSARAISESPQTGAVLTPEQIYRNAAPGVVVITDFRTEVIPSTFFTPAQKREVGALGSGFVIDKQGDIVTNDHVVQGASKIRVGFSSGASYSATVVGTDPSTDVALVRVKAPKSALHPLAFDDSAGTQVGDSVYAIGNPFGLDRTMTSGIVSAIGRDIKAPNNLTIPNAIQTDAPINHGNSGGPLLDRFGRVLGINAQIEGGSVDGNVGIGFAIPSDTARSIAQQLMTSGHAEHAWLGVSVEEVDPSLAQVVRGLPSHGLALAKVIKNGPAAKAGLEAATRQVTVNGLGALLGGDVITAADGTQVTSSAQLGEIVARHKPGDTLTLRVVRDGSTRTVHVTLGNVPAQS